MKLNNEAVYQSHLSSKILD
ncbi:hypothetical protein [Polynucleobacter sp.]